jgi:cytochrome c oxidase subunit 2
MDSILKFLSGLFTAHSPGAQSIDSLFILYLIFAAFMVVLIAGIVVTEAIRFRERRQPVVPKKIFGNARLEFAWTVTPLIIVGVFFALSLQAMIRIDSPNPVGRRPDIVVVAHQWWWELSYPEYHFITANELHIPVGKRLLMEVTSADVIHDWSVPELGRKIDAIPGKINYLWFEADKPGLYNGSCNEFCGAEHAWMLIRVIAQPQDEFDEWVRREREAARMPSGALSKAGAALFQNMTCGNCHSIAGTPDTASIGPNLTHLASRETILSGMLPNTRSNLEAWITNPQKIKPGARMPDFLLSQGDVDKLVAYLEDLK